MRFSGQRQGALVASLAASAFAQTYTSCNPLESTSCPPNAALGMAINVDFTQGEVNSFTAGGGGTVSYGSDGVSFTVAQSGDAPQLASVFYIMFGHVDFTMKAAPGAGIVSTLVMQSDDLDEIDMEWLGADDSEVQTNYFGKGRTTSYNRGAFNPAAGNQASFIKYSIDWTADRIVWSVADTVVRTLAFADADTDQYPQTPMQIKFGAWAGGDTATNAAGTVEWARGPTDFSAGPFSMVVQSIYVEDYSTGTAYTYGNTSGTWQSIEATDGEIGVNAGSGATATATATGTTATGTTATGTTATGLTVPAGIGSPSATVTATSTIPSGWVMTASGKIVPASSSTQRPQMLLVAAQVVGCLALGLAMM